MPGSHPIGRVAACRRAACVCAAALVAAILLSFWSEPLAAQTPPDVQSLANQAIRRLNLQTELPRSPEPFRFNLKLPPELLWAVVIVGLGIVLYAFRDMIPMLGSRRHSDWTGEDERAGEAGPNAPGVALGAADELAAQGRFVEAMHVLLLQVLAQMRRRLDEPFADSMTSREILRSSHLADGLRRPLRDVVNRVEWTYFGEHPATETDYLACRSSFNAVTQALHAAAAS